MNQSIAGRPGRLILFALAALVACAALSTAASAADYVALGDSYAAGPLIPNQIAPIGCLRSDHDYAHLAALGLGLSLRDSSCSGARTSDMTESQGVEFGSNPPQFNSLDASTSVVSVTIGGNDIGFFEVAESCIAHNPLSHPCLDKYDAGGVDQLKARIEATAPKVAAVLRGIHSRAPSARVFVLDYPEIFPETGSGCWPQLPFSRRDAPYLRSTEQRLNAMLATQAAANGAALVDWYQASLGHDACEERAVRWVEPLVPGSLAAPIHPNARGMEGGAAALRAAAR